MTIPAPIKPVNLEEIECNSAVEFISAISATPAKLEAPDFQNAWVYRGHGDAEWALQAAGWRPDGQKKLEPLREWLAPQVENLLEGTILFRGKVAKPDNRIEFALGYATEILAIRQFCDVADDIGLAIPDADKFPKYPQLLNIAIEAIPGMIYKYRYLEDFPIAFAQHHLSPLVSSIGLELQ